MSALPLCQAVRLRSPDSSRAPPTVAPVASELPVRETFCPLKLQSILPVLAARIDLGLNLRALAANQSLALARAIPWLNCGRALLTVRNLTKFTGSRTCLAQRCRFLVARSRCNR